MSGNSLNIELKEVQGLIAELKREFFTEKIALDDDETLVHKLCVRLENVLRYGLREKYTFMGTKKDYWNFISDSLSKDETVKFVQSLSDFKTNQGKGRAFLRQALMEKSLADTLQRCTINDRVTREYYVTDSVFRNDQHLQTLVHSLYDLNAVDFQLPYKGYDLDRSFPSLTRKTFEHKSRTSSTSTVDEQDVRLDPVQILNKKVEHLTATVDLWLGKKKDENVSSSDVPTLQKIINSVNDVNEDIIKLKSRKENDIKILKNNLAKLKEEKQASQSEMDLHVKQLHGQYLNIQNMDSSATSEKFKDIHDRLTSSELQLTEYKSKCSLLNYELVNAKKQLETSQEECENFKSENLELSKLLEESKNIILNQKQHEHSSECTNKIFEEKLVEVQKINDSMIIKEKEMNEKLLEQDSLLKIKENEIKLLQDAYEKSTGLVVGSFKELKAELSNELKEKTDALHTVNSTNEELSTESKYLLQEKSEMEIKIKSLEEQLLRETKKREDAEKTVLEMKMKITEGMKREMQLQQFVNQMCYGLSVNDESELLLISEYHPLDNKGGGDSLDKEDGLLKKSLKKKKKAEKLQKLEDDNDLLKKTTSAEEKEIALKKLFEMQQQLLELTSEKKVSEDEVVGLKYELASLNKYYKELSEKKKCMEEACEANTTNLMEKCSSLESEVRKLNIEIDKYNGGIMFNMSLDVTKLNEELVKKEQVYDDLNKSFTSLKELQEIIIIEKDELAKYKETASVKLEELENQVHKLTIERNSLPGKTESLNMVREEVSFLKGELDNVVMVKNQEIQGLKFQLSTEEMKRETAVKELADNLKTSGELSEYLKDIEIKQSEESGTWSSEKENLAEEHRAAKKQFEEILEKHAIAEKEIMFLKVEVSKLAKEKEDEKATRVSAWNKLNNMVEEKKKMEANYKEEIKQLNEDIDEIKNKLVSVTRDKHELWTKKDYLEFELKQKADERWVKDEEVANCTNCKELFTLTLRRHHCRLCGHIFCHCCSNKWIKTAHSRKRVRACNLCAEVYLETHGRSETDAVDGNSENQYDLSNMSDQVSLLSTDEDGNDAIVKDGPEEDISSSVDLPTDPSDIIDPADVSSSGSFGASEQIVILESDVLQTAVMPIVSVEDETTTEKLDFQLFAGQRSILPVIIGSSKVEFIWEFTSTPKDIGFGISYKQSEETSNEDMETVIPLSRYISHKQTIHGKMRIENPGVYQLFFNNSYSRVTTKHVVCSVGLARYKE